MARASAPLDGDLYGLDGLVRIVKRNLELSKDCIVVRLLPHEVASQVALALLQRHNRLLL